MLNNANNHSHLVMEEDHMDKIYHDSNKLVRYGQNKRLKGVVACLPLEKNLKILDAGCGEGHLLALIKSVRPEAELYGVDVTEVALASANKRLFNAKLFKSDIGQLDFAADFFDAVICTEVLEHVQNYQTALEELKRVTKPGGLLIITFPNEKLFTLLRFIFRRRPYKVPDHINSFTPKLISQTVSWPIITQKGLLFSLPFLISPHYLMVFRKTRGYIN